MRLPSRDGRAVIWAAWRSIIALPARNPRLFRKAPHTRVCDVDTYDKSLIDGEQVNDVARISRGMTYAEYRTEGVHIRQWQAHVRAFIVDDDPMILDALHATLSQAGIKAVKFTSAEQFLANTSRWHSGCVLADIRLPGMSGLELQTELARNNSLMSVIVMSGHADIPLAVQAMKAGALDVLEKPFNQRQILEVVRSALSVSSKKAARARQDGTASQRLETLTDRQKEILKLIAAGLANKEIAKALNLSPRTVEVHRARLMKKLWAGNVVELMHNAMINSSPLE